MYVITHIQDVPRKAPQEEIGPHCSFSKCYIEKCTNYRISQKFHSDELKLT